MIARKRSLALGSPLAGPLQGFDEADDRGQRRAQFVAGIGHEIGAHAFGVALFGLVMQQQKDKVRLGATNRFAGQMDRCHPCLINALAVALERIFNLAHRAAINNVV